MHWPLRRKRDSCSLSFSALLGIISLTPIRFLTQSSIIYIYYIQIHYFYTILDDHCLLSHWSWTFCRIEMCFFVYGHAVYVCSKKFAKLISLNGARPNFGCLFSSFYLYQILFRQKLLCSGGCLSRWWWEPIIFANQSFAAVWIDLSDRLHESYRLHFGYLESKDVFFPILLLYNGNILPDISFGLVHKWGTNQSNPKSSFLTLLFVWLIFYKIDLFTEES